MKSQLTIALACLALVFAVPISAADAPVVAKAPAVKKSLSKSGSFHTIHAKKAKTECDDCHSSTLPDETVMLRLHDKLAKGDPGPVNHETCYDCHSRPSKPLPFYAKK